MRIVAVGLPGPPLSADVLDLGFWIQFKVQGVGFRVLLSEVGRFR